MKGTIMKPVKRITCFLLIVVVAAVVACGDDSVTPPPQAEPARPVPETLDLRIDRTNAFAFDLYRELSSSGDNLVLSPHSIITAFAMAYAGARGTTERQMANVLHFNYPQAGFHSLIKELNDVLESRGATAGPDAFQLSIASAAWGRDDVTYLPSYVDTLSADYGAPLQMLDFSGDPEGSRLAINQWVSDRTHGLVQDLFPAGSITPVTYLALANTIFFHASWLHQFDPAYTGNLAFTRLDGSTVSVPVMSGEDYFPYYSGQGYQAVALRYKGEEVSMLLILPDAGTFGDFEASFSAAEVDSIVSSLRARDVIVRLPRFSFESTFGLSETLSAMGMPSAFKPGANFSGMDGTDDGVPWISFAGHRVFISVDEYGTLAAAGTGLGFSLGMPPVFDAVRPFLFVIRDDATGTILFLGRVLDPNA